MHKLPACLICICLAICISAPALAGEVVQGVPDGVVEKICANKFAEGNFVQVSVLQSANQKRRVYLLRPDITVFKHAPYTYFDKRGEVILTVPEFPIKAGEKPPILKERDKLIKGLVDEGSFLCEGK